MPPTLATVVYSIGIIGLFVLDRNRQARVSKALWIPFAWMLITGSRPLSVWLETSPITGLPQQNLEGSPIDAVFFAVLMAAGLLVLVLRRKRVKKILQPNTLILVFLAYCALSTLWSDHTFVAFKRWTKEVGDIEMVLVILTEVDLSVALKRLLASAAFLLLPISMLFIKYYPDLGRAYNYWTFEPMYIGITTNKNELGMICLVYGVGCLWCFLSAYKDRSVPGRNRRLLAHSAILLIAFWLLATSNSMTSVLCFFMAGGLMVMITLTQVGRKSAIVHLIVAASVAATSAVVFFGVGLKALGRDLTLTGRTEIWSIVLGVAGNPLVGTGFESFWLGDRLQRIWEAFGLHIQEAHNGYIEVYLNLGWIGILILAALIVSGYRHVLRAIRANDSLSALKAGFFLSAILYSFTEAGFRMLSPIWTAFLLVVIATPPSPISIAPPTAEIETPVLADVYEPEYNQ